MDFFFPRLIVAGHGVKEKVLLAKTAIGDYTHPTLRVGYRLPPDRYYIRGLCSHGPLS